MPQNWLFLTSYKKQRESLLQRVQWNLLAAWGRGAFETISGEVVQAVLLTQTRAPAPEGFALHGVDASAPKSAPEKALLLREGAVVAVSQKGQLGNPYARVTLDDNVGGELLERFASEFRRSDNWRYCTDSFASTGEVKGLKSWRFYIQNTDDTCLIFWAYGCYTVGASNGEIISNFPGVNL